MVHITEEQWSRIFALRDIFISERIGWHDLFPSQKETSNKIMKSVFLNKGETFVNEFTRQSGKTTIIVGTIGFLMLFYFALSKKLGLPHREFLNIGFFAPQIEQSKTDFTMLRQFLKKCEGQGFDFTFEEFNGNTINMKSKNYPPCMVYCFTASPTSHPESKTLNVIILEEAQDLDDHQVRNAILPMGAAVNATKVYIGVAGYKRCEFWNLINTLPDGNKVIIPYQTALKEREEQYKKYKDDFLLDYKRHIDEETRIRGKDNDQFKTQYELIWILERGQFITYENLMKLEEDYLIKESYGQYEREVGGIDWGKMNDSTVFTVMGMDGHIHAWYEFLGDDYGSQIEEITDLLLHKHMGCFFIHCDATANQDMAVDFLRKRIMEKGINCQIEGVKFNPQTKDSMYKGASKLMHDVIFNSEIIQKSILRFPTKFSIEKEKFIRQFLDLQKDIRGNKWACEAPAGPQYHDDYTDSCVLACIALVEEEIRPEVEWGLA